MISQQGVSSILEGGRNPVQLKSDTNPVSSSQPKTRFSTVLDESTRQQDRDIKRNNNDRSEKQAPPPTPSARSSDGEKAPGPADSSQAPTRSGDDHNKTDATGGTDRQIQDQPPAPDATAKSKTDGEADVPEDTSAIDGSLAWTSVIKDAPDGTSDISGLLGQISTEAKAPEDSHLVDSDGLQSASIAPEANPVHALIAPRTRVDGALDGSPRGTGLEGSTARAGKFAERSGTPPAAAADPAAATPTVSGLPTLPGWLHQLNKATGLNTLTPPSTDPLAALVATTGTTSHTLAPGPSATAHLSATPGTPEFTQHLGVEVMLMTRDGIERATLTLNPADLGPIQIDLKMHAQVADLSFVVAHATTRDAIEQSLPKLGEMLASQGLSLGSSHVGSDGARHGASTSQQNIGTPVEHGRGPHESSRMAGHAMDRRSLVSLSASARGGIDLYA